MNIKKLVLLLFLVVTPVAAYVVKAQGSTVYDPAWSDTIYPIQDDAAPALMALAAMHSPMWNEAAWSRMICTGMTEGGCAYFTEFQALDTWQSQSGNIGSSSNFIVNVKSINENVQVWKAQVTAFAPEKKTISGRYLLVRRGADGRWYLDRMLNRSGSSS
jgi:hypothetical protein